MPETAPESDNDSPAATLTETAPPRATGAEIAVPLTPESVVMLPVTVKLFPAIEKLADWNSSDWNEVPAVKSFCVEVSDVPWKINWSPALGATPACQLAALDQWLLLPPPTHVSTASKTLSSRFLDPQLAGFVAGILAVGLGTLLPRE